jgi:hypothetical protein
MQETMRPSLTIFLCSLENLQNSPQRMFLNGLYTDGYTCRVLFCKKVSTLSDEQKIELELGDLSTEEVEKHFRPCTVDPGRTDTFVSFHEGTDIRRLSCKSYYNMYGTVRRQKQQQSIKKDLGIATIETNIPSPKTSSCEQYVSYTKYILEHLNTLFSFYNFDTSKNRWLAYLSSQKTIEECVNILINGGSKYNKKRRKKNKKRRNMQDPKETTQETTTNNRRRYVPFLIFLIASSKLCL